MRVQFVRERSFSAAGPNGPFVRVFAVGQVVEVESMHGAMLVAAGDAVDADKAKPAKAPQKAEEAVSEPVSEPVKVQAKASAKKSR